MQKNRVLLRNEKSLLKLYKDCKTEQSCSSDYKDQVNKVEKTYLQDLDTVKFQLKVTSKQIVAA